MWFGHIPPGGGGNLLPQSEYYLPQYLPVHGGWRKKALLVLYTPVEQKAAEIPTMYRTLKSKVILEDVYYI